MPDRTPLFLLEIELDSGTQYLSSKQVNHPSRTYEPFVISWGSIEQSIPSPCGLPIISDAQFKLAESEAYRFRDILAHETPRRRKCTIWALFPGESLTYRDPNASPPEVRTPFWKGEIQDVTFNGDGSIDFTAKDLTFAWLDEPFPAMITRDIYEGLDPRYEGQALPIVAGQVRTPGIDDSPPNPSSLKGQIALPRMGWNDETGDRWGVAAHPVSSIRVFRKEEMVVDDDTEEVWVEVDPSEYTISLVAKTAFNLSMNHTVIDFFVEQPDGTELRADIDGIDYRGPWGSLAEVGYNQVASPPYGTPGALRNPIDFFIATTFFFMNKAGVSGGDGSVFDTDEISALRDLFESLGYYCDGAITQSMTCREFLGQFLACFNLDMWQKRNGKISLNYTGDEDPDRLVFTETSDILKGFSEKIPTKNVNQIQYRFKRNFAEEAWGDWKLYDNPEQLIQATPAGTRPEKDVFDQFFIRDEPTALAMATKRGQFQSLGSYAQTWEMPLPRVPVTFEPSRQVGVTHRKGLEVGGYTNREVKTLGLVHELDRLVTRFSGILREPQTIVDQYLRPTIVEITDQPAPHVVISDTAKAIDMDPFGVTPMVLEMGGSSSGTVYDIPHIHGFPAPTGPIVSATISFLAEYYADNPTWGPGYVAVELMNILNDSWFSSSGQVSIITLGIGTTASPKAWSAFEINAADWAAYFGEDAANIYLRCILGDSSNASGLGSGFLKIYDVRIAYQYA